LKDLLRVAFVLRIQALEGDIEIVQIDHLAALLYQFVSDTTSKKKVNGRGKNATAVYHTLYRYPAWCLELTKERYSSDNELWVETYSRAHLGLIQ